MIIRWNVAVHRPTEEGHRLIRVNYSVRLLYNHHNPVRVRHVFAITQFASYTNDEYSTVFWQMACSRHLGSKLG